MLNGTSSRYRMQFLAIVATVVMGVSFQCGSAAAADALQARKEIKTIGLEYTGQDFAKAAGNGDMTAVQLFLNAGMDVNEGGSAAIGLAAGRGKTKMVQFLLSKGAKPTSNALQYARTRGYQDIEKILVDAGAKE